MNTYLVTLLDQETSQIQKIWVKSPCPCGMQEFIDELKDDPNSDLTMAHPIVVNVTESKIALSVA